MGIEEMIPLETLSVTTKPHNNEILDIVPNKSLGENPHNNETKDIGPNKSLGEFCGSGIYLAPKLEYCIG
jgi:hypothetical protein